MLSPESPGRLVETMQEQSRIYVQAGPDLRKSLSARNNLKLVKREEKPAKRLQE